MAVPDWPNTYGYNMFFFPVSQWVGGIFYEHTHRLVASAVGLLTVVLALWLYGRSARPVMRWGVILLLLGSRSCRGGPAGWADGAGHRPGRLGVAWRKLDLAALRAEREMAVPVRDCRARCRGPARGARRIAGVLLKDAIGIFHATLAQLFFVLICAIALFTSRWWQTLPSRKPSAINYRLSTLLLLTTIMILGQLALGAAMRHQHAGLAIPDFPLAYGRLWPAMDAASVAYYNQQRMEILAFNPITAFQIGLQMIASAAGTRDSWRGRFRRLVGQANAWWERTI